VRRVWTITGGLAPQRRIDRAAAGTGRLMRTKEIHRLAHDAMIRRVHDEQRAIRQHLLDESCVREAVVQATIAVAVVGIVEEDQVAGRSELGAVHASVTLDPADDGPHTVVARPAFGEEIDIGALVQGVEISRAVRGHRIPVEPRAADPESVARGGEDNFDGIGR